jgi:hypothetical protein
MPSSAQKMQSQLEELPPGSTRRSVLECARRFKASWIDLGRALSEVKRDGLWRVWGFQSFDAYCAKELFIRKQTAEKLTLSYGFIERHEPALLDDRERRAAPGFEVIEVLSRAEAAGRFSEEGWREMREEILERPPTPASLNRQLTDRYGPPARKEQPAGAERLRGLAALARRLASACAAGDEVPRAVVERARALAEDLDELACG